MKILVTGAHLTPAIATIEKLKKYPDVKIVYVGRNTTQEGDSSLSLESQILPALGIKFIPITAGRLQRSFTVYTIPSLLKIPIGFLQSFLIILKEKPDAILSFGGYVAVPVVIVGWLFSIPIIIHEQTLVSGLANKISALFTDKVALGFDNVHIKNEKAIYVGNPLRDEIKNPVKKLPSEYNEFFRSRLPTILIMGGNQGSHTINKKTEEILEKLTKIASIIHITGNNKFNDFERLKEFQSENYLVKKWIGKEIGAVLRKVDFIISRAGVNTLSEIFFLGKRALVIPLEPLYKDEQNKNAKYFKEQGFVKIIPQSKLSAQSLLDNIKDMIKEKNKKIVKKNSGIDAAERLALETILLINS